MRGRFDVVAAIRRRRTVPRRSDTATGEVRTVKWPAAEAVRRGRRERTVPGRYDVAAANVAAADDGVAADVAVRCGR